MKRSIPIPIVGLVGLLLAVDGIVSWLADAPVWGWGVPWAIGSALLAGAMTLRTGRSNEVGAGVGAVIFVAFVAIVWLFGFQISGVALDHIVSILMFLVVIVATVAVGIFTMLRGRAGAEGANVWVYVVAGLIVVILVNYLAARHVRQRFDLTATGLQSLSQQTVAKLAGLDEDVHAIALFRDDNPARTSYGELLKMFQDESAHFSFEIIDPDKFPDIARQESVQEYPAVVLKCADRREVVIGPEERDLTSALIRVTRPGTPVIYFTTWHQERDLATDLSSVSAHLRRLNYRVQPLRVSDGEIPSDAELLVVAGPRSPFLPIEIERVERYVAKGKRLLVMLDPDTTGYGLEDLLAVNGINVRPNFIVERQRGLVPHAGGYYMGEQQAVYSRVTRYGDSPIAQDLADAGVAAGFYLTREVRWRATDPDVTDLVCKPIAFAGSNMAFVEQDVAGVLTNPRQTFQPDDDRVGPFAVAVSADAAATDPLTPESVRTRIVAFGDSDFITDRSVEQESGNLSLFLNAVTWLTEDEELIAIQPRSPGSKPVRLTRSQATFVFLLSVWRYPALVLVIGLYVWWYRRGRGPASA